MFPYQAPNPFATPTPMPITLPLPSAGGSALNAPDVSDVPTWMLITLVSLIVTVLPALLTMYFSQRNQVAQLKKTNDEALRVKSTESVMQQSQILFEDQRAQLKQLSTDYSSLLKQNADLAQRFTQLQAQFDDLSNEHKKQADLIVRLERELKTERDYTDTLIHSLNSAHLEVPMRGKTIGA